MNSRARTTTARTRCVAPAPRPPPFLLSRQVRVVLGVSRPAVPAVMGAASDPALWDSTLTVSVNGVQQVGPRSPLHQVGPGGPRAACSVYPLCGKGCLWVLCVRVDGLCVRCAARLHRLLLHRTGLFAKRPSACAWTAVCCVSSAGRPCTTHPCIKFTSAGHVLARLRVACCVSAALRPCTDRDEPGPHRAPGRLLARHAAVEVGQGAGPPVLCPVLARDLPAEAIQL
jgi:hypothetical protein